MLGSSDIRDEPFGLASERISTATIRLLDDALHLHGGTLADDPAECGILAPAATVTRMSPAELADLRRRAERAPLFLFVTESSEVNEAAAALAALGGPLLRAYPPTETRAFRFESRDELWPFGGLTLAEGDARRQATLILSDASVESLISTEAGSTFLSWALGSRRVYLSLVPLAADASLLKHEFRASRFMGLLPLLVFARLALGPRGWRTPEPLASFIVDDPNLRSRHYGFLDLERLLGDERLRHAHFTIAMIPLDFSKTRPACAKFFREHADRLSLVMHGVDHRWCEFDSAVSPREAEHMLSQAIARMAIHRARHGVNHAQAMTFPHGKCNETWLKAMRDAGLDAALTDRAFPFRSEDELDDRLYELLPAQTTFAGFPIVNRFKAEHPKEELLFQAYLGKPLVIYTHHAFFRPGLEPLVELTEFMDDKIAPRWTNVATILASNFQTRSTHSGWQVRVFSNRVELRSSSHRPLEALIKPGRDFAADERGWMDGFPLQLEAVVNVGLAVAPELFATPAVIEFGPARRLSPPRRIRTSFVSRARRMATEARDRSMGVIAGRLKL